MIVEARLLLFRERQKTKVEHHLALSARRPDVATEPEKFSAEEAGGAEMRWGYTP